MPSGLKRPKSVPTSKSSKFIIGITMGDPSGIGPQITLKAISKFEKLADFIIIGDSFVLNKAAKLLRRSSFIPHPSCLVDLKNVDHSQFKFGKLKAEYGRASLEYIDKALELIREKKIDALVTCPVSKEAINKAGFSFSGHTEYLAKQSNTTDFAMMLLNQKLKTVLLTRHIAISKVPANINKKALIDTIKITYNGLKSYFSIQSPRLVICGLNPHASDNGVIGNEENEVIKPVINKLKKTFPGLTGPAPADIAIAKTVQGEFDCCIAMYHDQALIPLKILGYNLGVNMTLGLPFIRTSPLHGTAFDIAASRNAKADSLIEAVKLATQCCQNQKKD